MISRTANASPKARTISTTACALRRGELPSQDVGRCQDSFQFLQERMELPHDLLGVGGGDSRARFSVA